MYVYIAVQADISPAAQHTHADKVVEVQIPKPKLPDEDVATFETPHRAQLNVNAKPWLHPHCDGQDVFCPDQQYEQHLHQPQAHPNQCNVSGKTFV